MIKVDDFYYELPPELIAQEPVEPRDASRLLVVHRATGRLEHLHFHQIDRFLHPRDALVLNNTRVMPARLWGRRQAGGQVEVVLLRCLEANRWEALVRPGRRIRPGDHLSFGEGQLTAIVSAVAPAGGRVLQFEGQGAVEQLLTDLGELPLPPYIHNQPPDPERYQTIYAEHQGSVAAPTAGLHFTRQLLTQLQAGGVHIASILLHIGLGTFRPVRCQLVEEHQMHAEYYRVDSGTANLLARARGEGGKIVAVGTSACRALESAADSGGTVKPAEGWTEAFFYPGYYFRTVQALVTNFHLPRSTLFMLVCAFADRDLILHAYQEAIRLRYRFYSFGDAMLIL